MTKIWRVGLSGVSADEPRAYRKNLTWLIAADTAESAVQSAMKHATGSIKMVQVVIWSVQFIGDLTVIDEAR